MKILTTSTNTSVHVILISGSVSALIHLCVSKYFIPDDLVVRGTLDIPQSRYCHRQSVGAATQAREY